MLDDTDISSDLAEARGKLNAARKALQVVLGVQDGRDGDLASLQGYQGHIAIFWRRLHSLGKIRAEFYAVWAFPH